METVAAILVFMGLVVVGAATTNSGKELCEAMGGVHTPQPPPADSCPGGKWSNLFKQKPTPQ
jgi:hypothetical protein